MEKLKGFEGENDRDSSTFSLNRELMTRCNSYTVVDDNNINFENSVEKVTRVRYQRLALF